MDNENVSDYETLEFIKFQKALMKRMNKICYGTIWNQINLRLVDDTVACYKLVIYRRSSGLIYLKRADTQTDTEMMCMEDVYRVFIEESKLRNSETINTIRSMEINDFVDLLELDD